MLHELLVTFSLLHFQNNVITSGKQSFEIIDEMADLAAALSPYVNM